MVKIVKNTNSAYGYLQIGDLQDVDKQTADRWIEHGIAVLVEPKRKEPDYSDMTLKELREIAKAKEVDKYYKLSKTELVREVSR